MSRKFLALWDRGDEDIRFAERWGPLRNEPGEAVMKWPLAKNCVWVFNLCVVAVERKASSPPDRACYAREESRYPSAYRSISTCNQGYMPSAVRTSLQNWNEFSAQSVGCRLRRLRRSETLANF